MFSLSHFGSGVWSYGRTRDESEGNPGRVSCFGSCEGTRLTQTTIDIYPGHDLCFELTDYYNIEYHTLLLFITKRCYATSYIVLLTFSALTVKLFSIWIDFLHSFASVFLMGG